jgi:RHS repeat-associated protein
MRESVGRRLRRALVVLLLIFVAIVSSSANRPAGSPRTRRLPSGSGIHLPDDQLSDRLAALSAPSAGPSSGAYQSRIPINVPPFHGIEPKLDLAYNSQGGNGWLGVGWGLNGLSSIERHSAGRGVPTYDSSDRYFLDGVELLACLPAERHRPATDSPSCHHPASTDPKLSHKANEPPYMYYATKAESFERIAFDPNADGGRWYVWNKLGVKLTYSSRLTGPYPVQPVFGWHLATVEDPLGNKVTYSYWQDSTVKRGLGQEYLESVAYDHGQVEVRFYSEPRASGTDPDTYWDTISGATGRSSSLLVTRYRLKTIDITVGSGRARTYALTYTRRDGNTSRSLLTQVQEYGSDTTIDSHGTIIKGSALPPVTLTQEETPGAGIGSWTGQTDSVVPWPPRKAPRGQPYDDETRFINPAFGPVASSSDPSTVPPHRWLAGDVNGDGREDVILVSISAGGGPPVTITTGLSAPDGHYQQFPGIPTWGEHQTQLSPRSFLLTWFFAADVDGDGLTDIVGINDDIFQLIGGFKPATIYVAFSNGDGTYRYAEQPTDWVPSPHGDFKYVFRLDIDIGFPFLPLGVGFTWPIYELWLPHRYLVNDVTGDGKADIVLLNRETLKKPDGSSYEGVGVHTAVSTGRGFLVLSDNQLKGTPWEWADPHVNLSRFFPGDVDADGKTDIMMVTPRAGRVGFNIGLSRGDGTFTSAPYDTVEPWRDTDMWFPGDPNGDGFTDFMEVVKLDDNEHAGFRTWLSDGSGRVFRSSELYPTNMLFWQPIPCTGSWSPTFFFPGDSDGDGRTDFMQVAVPHHYVCADDVKGQHYTLKSAQSRPNGQYEFTSRDLLRSVTPLTREFIPADINGDRRTDVVYAANAPCLLTCEFLTPYALATALSPVYRDALRDTGRDVFGWQPAEINGDGRTDLVYSQFLNPGFRIYTILRDGQGRLQQDQAGDVVVSPTDILPSSDIPGLNNPAMEWFPTDVNADGKSDLVALDYEMRCTKSTSNDICNKDVSNSQLHIYTLIRDGASWKPVHDSWKGFAPEDVRQWRIASTNADGRLDLVQVQYFDEKDTAGKTHHGIRLNALTADGNGKWSKTSIPAWPEYARTDAASWVAMDANGDGRTDFIHLNRWLPVAGPYFADSLLSTAANTWRHESSLIKIPSEQAGYWNVNDLRNWRPMDINGDGTEDLARVGVNGLDLTVHSLFSNGDGSWIATSHPADPPVSLPGQPNTPPEYHWAGTDLINWRAGDINADGRSDLVHIGQGSSGTQVDTLVSRGDGNWSGQVEPAVQIGSPVDQLPPLGLGVHGQGAAGESTPLIVASSVGWQLDDVNGDGKTDLTHMDSVDRFDGRSVGVQASTVLSGAPLDLTTSFANGMGGTTTVDYRPSSAWQRNDGGDRCALSVGAVLQMVSSTTTYDADSSTTDTHSQSYRCPNWSYAQRRLLGWQEVTTTHLSSADRPTSVLHTTYFLSEGCGAQPTETDYNDAAGNHFSRRASTYIDSHPTSTSPYNCLPRTIQDSICNLTTSCVSRSILLAYDGFGNIVRSDETEEGAPKSSSRIHTARYTTAADSYIVGLPSSMSVHEAGTSTEDLGRLLKFTRYCYDNDHDAECITPPASGLLTAVSAWNDRTNQDETSTYRYDDVGNMVAATDANGHTATTTYDDQLRLYPHTTCNALDQCSSSDWDVRIGQIIATSDANGTTTSYKYDPFGRLILANYPNGKTHWRDYLDFGDPQHQRIIDSEDDGSAYDGTSAGLWTETYFDGLGRTYRTLRKGEKTGSPMARNTLYADASSLPYKRSNWYRLGASQPSYEAFQYDGAGRLIQRLHPDNSRLRWTYTNDRDGLWTHSFDELGHERAVRSDAFGQVAEVVEVQGGEHRTTSYEYDPVGNPTRVIDAAGNIATAAWDSLGQNIRYSDPDMGAWFYHYDPAGNLKSQVDARGVRTEFTYDALDRLTTKQSDPPHGATTVWNYDQRKDKYGAGIGRLTSVQDPTSASCQPRLSEELVYNSVGQVTAIRKCVFGKTYQLAFTYDMLGRPESVTYPGTRGEPPEIVRYDYDPAGRLRSMPGYVNSITYDPSGQIETMELANGVRESYSYDPARHWVSGKNISQGSKDLYQGSFKFDPNGIMRSSLATQNVDSHFGYDDLGRLTTVDGTITREYRYDPLGDITYKSQIGTYSYPPSGPNGCGTNLPCARPHAVTSAGGHTYHYDENGNTTSRDGLALYWNSDNRPTWIQYRHGIAGQAWLHLAYDASGQRVFSERRAKVPSQAERRNAIGGPAANANSGTRYFGRLLDYTTTKGLTKYYYIGSRLVARKDATGTYWYHQDHLGSTKLMTNRRGESIAGYDYDPYGALVGSTGSVKNDIGFGGQRTDAETGLVLMGARYYDPQIGRFISAESNFQAASNPQASNPYSYSYNSPLAFVDYSGHHPTPTDPDQAFSAVEYGKPGEWHVTFLDPPDGVDVITAPAAQSPEAETASGGPPQFSFMRPWETPMSFSMPDGPVTLGPQGSTALSFPVGPSEIIAREAAKVFRPGTPSQYIPLIAMMALPLFGGPEAEMAEMATVGFEGAEEEEVATVVTDTLSEESGASPSPSSPIAKVNEIKPLNTRGIREGLRQGGNRVGPGQRFGLLTYDTETGEVYYQVYENASVAGQLGTEVSSELLGKVPIPDAATPQVRGNRIEMPIRDLFVRQKNVSIVPKSSPSANGADIVVIVSGK